MRYMITVTEGYVTSIFYEPVFHTSDGHIMPTLGHLWYSRHDAPKPWKYIPSKIEFHNDHISGDTPLSLDSVSDAIIRTSILQLEADITRVMDKFQETMDIHDVLDRNK